MIKLYLCPDYKNAPPNADNGGIRRVVDAKAKYLPAMGFEIVHRPEDAHIIVNNGAMLATAPGVPIVNVNHGLYWSRQPWEAGFQEVNAEVVNSMCNAVAHTVPSEWVARAVRRGGYFYPEVVYHGVEADEFKPAPEWEEYVLWNKARADLVSDPNDMITLAARMPETRFQTTIGFSTGNVKVLGILDYRKMRDIVARAGVYLCTARETFGIGTLEALACGVPVAGWDWGGQSEIIVPGETGYLAPPGDYEALQECVERCFADRDRLSANAISDVRARWGWQKRMEQYAAIFKRVYHEYYEIKRPKVSVIVTAYNLDAYLPKCLDMISKQTMQDFECLVIDDAQQFTTFKIVDSYTRKDKRIQYLAPNENLGLPGARNFGFAHSCGSYIRHVDADDFLAENALELESHALDVDPGLHIAYGHLESVNEDGSRILENGEPVRSGWPPEDFEWVEQMAHLNQLPSCVMMRREVLQRSGGYRTRMHRQEDAEFWCRVTSLGFRAHKITQAVTYFHRQRDDSKGAKEWQKEGPEPDWTSWFPWRVGATNYRQAVEILRSNAGRHPTPRLVPFGAQGKNPQGGFWPVHDYAYPVVSVIVTCGPGHQKYLLDALDSIQAQTFPDWECVVVNDTGEKWEPYIMGAPWAKVINLPKNMGVSTARNEGFKYARGKFIVFLDGDDYWLPWFLELMVTHAEKNDGVIFSDLIQDDGKEKKVYKYAEFDPQWLVKSMRYPGSSVLYPRKIVEKVMANQGGFDLQIPGMEDWDFQIAVHAAGFCAYHIPEPLFVYRMYSSTKRDVDYAKIDSITAYLDEKWAKYRKGGDVFMCGCGNNKRVTTQPASLGTSSGDPAMNVQVEEGAATKMVQVEYVGPIAEDFSIRSKIDRNIFYRFGNNQWNKERTVFLADAEFLTSQTDGDGAPLYRILGDVMAAENRDPSVALGQPVAA